MSSKRWEKRYAQEPMPGVTVQFPLRQWLLVLLVFIAGIGTGALLAFSFKTIAD
jgi:hypothetical protein